MVKDMEHHSQLVVIQAMEDLLQVVSNSPRVDGDNQLLDTVALKAMYLHTQVHLLKVSILHDD